MRFNRAAFASISLLTFSCVASAAIGETAVTGGRVQGVSTDGVTSFKGIPFAAPPTGAMRWKSPQAVVPWSGTKKADAYAPSCLQAANMLALMGAPPAMSEDCLYLNVWTAAQSAGEKRPVMVWIYGGAFAAGTTNSPTYDGVHFARQGVVLVSIAYRVGPYGFLAHPELSKENGSSGAQGLEDMIAGLRWVKDNIAKFGGDPSNVTIFGESAGGIAVSMLTISPPAKGLFAKAISESGGNFAPPRTGAAGGNSGAAGATLKLAEQTGVAYFKAIGAADLKAARALPVGKLEVPADTPGGPPGFWPVYDGRVLPGDAYLLYQAGKFNDTPVLIGTNSDEGAMFAAPGMTPARFEQQVRGTYGENADLVLKVNPHADDPQAARASKNVFRDSVFAWPTFAWAELQAKHSRNKAWIYYFDHRTPQSPEGANHASEIGYVFGTLALRANGPVRAEDARMSELMNRYWVNFAKSGDPNGAGLPQWPAYDLKSKTAMVFDANPSARPLPNQEQLKAFDELFAKQRAKAARP